MTQDQERVVSAFASLSSEQLRNLYGAALRFPPAFTFADTAFELCMRRWDDLSSEEFTACFELVKGNLMSMYKNSTLGWSSKKKMAEMKENGLIYILLKLETATAGFISFMVTVEEGEVVAYCYELQLPESLRGRGLGKALLNMMEDIALQAGVPKSMLTVFSSNPAQYFYRSLGYAPVEHSPRAKNLRKGVVKQPSYYILGKSLL
ncbi:acyl-CoA N-acyltransferase [Lipomyces kononenkoae]|uniref:Acyl-CoA N-acyltransferase n=1 Tax=Lipomyces kononenkoae TaxID=34357 RepID=A0ACC3TAR7_LIPKO